MMTTPWDRMNRSHEGCGEEWLAARAEDTSRLVSEFVRAFVTRSKTVLQPPQMSLPIGAGGSVRCSTS